MSDRKTEWECREAYAMGRRAREKGDGRVNPFLGDDPADPNREAKRNSWYNGYDKEDSLRNEAGI